MITAKERGLPLADKTRALLDLGGTPGTMEGKEEDMHALGLTLLTALTGTDPSSLPAPPKRQLAIRQLLNSRGNVSAEIS